jgi:hypothetical protein
MVMTGMTGALANSVLARIEEAFALMCHPSVSAMP